MRQRRWSFFPYLLAFSILANAGACSPGTSAKIVTQEAAAAAATLERAAAAAAAAAAERTPAAAAAAERMAAAAAAERTAAAAAVASDAIPEVPTGFRHKLVQWRERFPEAGSVMQESICATIGHVLITQRPPTLDDFAASVEEQLLRHAVRPLDAWFVADEVRKALSEKSDTPPGVRLQILRWQEDCSQD